MSPNTDRSPLIPRVIGALANGDWLTKSQIANRAGLSMRQIEFCMDQMVRRGMAIKESRGGGGRNPITFYRKAEHADTEAAA